MLDQLKSNVLKLIKKQLEKKLKWIPSHPIAGSEVSGPEYGNKNLFLNKWCVIIREKTTHLKKLECFKKSFGKN